MNILKWRVKITLDDRTFFDRYFSNKTEAMNFYNEKYPNLLYKELFHYEYPNWKSITFSC